MVVVIDYRAGNLYNVAHALKFLGAKYRFSGDPEVVKRASKVILPGVGSARPAMQSLDQQGLVEVLRELEVPLLGICLGLQLLFEKSEEDETDCLGVFPDAIRKFDNRAAKVPHIGWNQVRWLDSGEGLLQAIPPASFLYFVHSYYAPSDTRHAFATTEYGVVFASAVRKDNFVGFQFHPERSGEIGLRLLQNFLNL